MRARQARVRRVDAEPPAWPPRFPIAPPLVLGRALGSVGHSDRLSEACPAPLRVSGAEDGARRTVSRKHLPIETLLTNPERAPVWASGGLGRSRGLTASWRMVFSGPQFLIYRTEVTVTLPRRNQRRNVCSRTLSPTSPPQLLGGQLLRRRAPGSRVGQDATGGPGLAVLPTGRLSGDTGSPVRPGTATDRRPPSRRRQVARSLQ